jgi:hypothetical protein
LRQLYASGQPAKAAAEQLPAVAGGNLRSTAFAAKRQYKASGFENFTAAAEINVLKIISASDYLQPQKRLPALRRHRCLLYRKFGSQ